MRGFSHLSCVSKSSRHSLVFQLPDCIAFLAGIYILATLFSCSRGMPLKSLTVVCRRGEMLNCIHNIRSEIFSIVTGHKMKQMLVHIINPRRAFTASVTVVVLRVCLSVCLFVYDYSRTTGYEAAYERYRQLQCYKGMKKNVAILLKPLCSRDMA